MSSHLQYKWEVIIELRTCCHELAPPTAATMAAQARVTTDNVNNTALNLVRSNDSRGSHSHELSERDRDHLPT